MITVLTVRVRTSIARKGDRTRISPNFSTEVTKTKERAHGRPYRPALALGYTNDTPLDSIYTINMELLNQSLAEKLLTLTEIDRTMRMKVINGEAEWDSSVDEASQASLMEIVEESGWPTISQVGSSASQAAWQLVQHAPDLSFMERCLELMEALPQEEINPANIAYLKDRVLIMSGKPQLYGTQYKGKDLQLYPIEDPEHVEERRARMGLNTLAEDEAVLRALYKATS